MRILPVLWLKECFLSLVPGTSAVSSIHKARSDALACRHRYFFRLFALDSQLPSLSAGAGRAELDRAMEVHILASAVLMGTYATSTHLVNGCDGICSQLAAYLNLN